MGTVPLAQDVGVSGLSCGKLESSPWGTLRGTTRHAPPDCCPGRCREGLPFGHLFPAPAALVPGTSGLHLNVTGQNPEAVRQADTWHI